tara:strand:+ start:453 stop:2267 length:1815 start_codon:yes stop_codon:yes gene_type:complete
VPKHYDEKNKTVAIKYTSRDFNAIKGDLVEYARRYYPDTYRDFSEASFGSLVLDTVAYVGDILSYYLDYQANESFLDTSIEIKNIVNLSKQLGYKQKGAPSSMGIVTFYISLPASSDGIGADLNYAPVLQRGANFTSAGGTTFTLVDDVDFSNPQNEMVVSQVDPVTGVPTRYAIRSYGMVMSGVVEGKTINVGPFQRYPRFRIDANNISEVISVFDSDGNKYFEVDYLVQDVIYKQILNNETDNNEVPFLLKPVSAPRRYVVEHEYGQTFLQFGHGDDNSLTKNNIIDTTKIALDMHGRDYITDKSFDPSKLISTDKMGIAPSNTVLTVFYRRNTSGNTSAGTNSLTNMINQDIVFSNSSTLSSQEMSTVINSIEYINEAPITGGETMNTTEDIKKMAYGSFGAQNRAVTREDYQTIAYMMPAQFGAISKAHVMRDSKSFKRNLNMYVLSRNREGSLQNASMSVKNNLKSWLASYKMINDTIDILDARIVNIGIEFTAIGDTGFNKNQVLQMATTSIIKDFASRSFEIGESLRIGDVFRVLKNIDGILDVVEVKFNNKLGNKYSSSGFDIAKNTSADGRLLTAPEDGVFEIKFPSSDIMGTIL